MLEDMLRACVLEFSGSWDDYLPLMEFAYKNNYHATIQMAPYEALYGRKCRSPICCTEAGERKLLGPELVQLTTNKIKIIRDKILVAQSRQKSYADNRRRDLEFAKRDFVFLKVSPCKGIFRFSKKGKLSPRYIGPFEFLDRVGATTYHLELPVNLSRLHNVFHVYMLKKYLHDPSHVLSSDPIDLREDLSYVEEPVRIIDRKDQVLCTKVIPLVKVLWRSHSVEETTWESEESMRRDHPYLFD